MASSVEERLEKLEKHKTNDQKRQERTAELEKLKKTPIKYVDDDPKRIHMSYDEVVKAKQAKKDEMAEFEKFKADKKKAKEEPKPLTKADLEKAEKALGALTNDKPKSKGRPKKIE